MYSKDNLENLEKFVVSQAEDKKNTILKELEAQRESEIEKYKNKLEIHLERYFKDSFEKVCHDAIKKVAEKSFEYKKEYFCERERLIQQVFENVTKKLEDYVKTDVYVNSMEKKIRSAMGISGHDYTVVISSADNKLIELAKAKGYNTQIIDRKFIGGCRVIDNTAKTMVDMTFANSMEIESNAFLEKYFELN